MTEPRPFYHRFAWAYDLLLNGPIDARVQAIVALLNKHGVRPPDTLLDAGCGTGRYSAALAQRGYRVLGVDRSAEFVRLAQTRRGAANGNPEYVVGDLTALRRAGGFAAILSRGVLNDLLTDTERELVALRFAELLAPGGALLVDVRDWARTTQRYRARPSAERSIALADGGDLTFRSRTTLDPSAQRMLVSETFEHRMAESGHVERVASEFRMRCWSAHELHRRLGPWFQDVEILPDYVTPPAWTDRLVFVGTRRRS